MKFGLCLPNYGEELSAEKIAEFASKAEELQYDSLWSTDHLLMQHGSNTPYERIYESISTLLYLSAKTARIKLGVSSLVMALRNPVIVAKQLATLDNFSNGRVMLATGAGWYQPEFSSLGSDFKKRGRVLDESIMLIRILWNSSGGEINFEGKYTGVKIEKGIFMPEPIQKKLEIWIAGSSEPAMRRASKLGDAWHPNVLPLDSFSTLVKRFREINSSLPICVRVGVNPYVKTNEYIGPQGDRRFALTEDKDANIESIERLESLGVSYAILALNPNGRIPFSKQIDMMNKLASYLIK